MNSVSQNIKKLNLRSNKLKFFYKMIRVQSFHQNPEDTKEEVYEIMNNYLEQYDGKLINIKILKNGEICIYFITGDQYVDQNWEQTLKNGILSKY